MDYLSFKNQQGKKGKEKQSKKGKKTKRTKKVTKKSKVEKPTKVAAKTLKENLKQEYQVSLTVDGNTNYVAGARIELDESWGKFEGVYTIDKVTHSISGGDYTCDLEMLKVGARERATQKAKEETKAEKAAKQAEKNKNKKK